ncbi:hypothetical protein BHM03_00002040 [Ensete ventricosum]|nr:hypothetical protein BHM03_00002040 [Ensete ventricosum]
MAGAEGEPRKGVTRQATRENDGVANPPPPVAMVTFPDAARRRAQNFPPPLKLECEDSTEDMNPRNLWQVVPPSSTLSFLGESKDREGYMAVVDKVGRWQDK